MHAIYIDDQTYLDWEKHALAEGVSVEDWLRDQVAAKSVNAIEDRRARLRKLNEFIEKQNIRVSPPVEWSSEAYYD